MTPFFRLICWALDPTPDSLFIGQTLTLLSLLIAVIGTVGFVLWSLSLLFKALL